MQRLHPNLARVAVEYDEARTRCLQRRITEAQFRREALALVARDDEGVQWSIDPDSGQWVYLDRRGQRIPGQPPQAGVVTPSAYDLTRDRSVRNPDSQLLVEAVGPRHDPEPGLRGITYRSDDGSSPARARSARLFLVSPLGRLVLAAIAALLLLVTLLVLRSSPATSPQQPPAHSPVSAVPVPAHR